MNTFATQPKVQQKALQEALQSPYIGKHGKRKETIAFEKALKEKAERIVEEMITERTKMLSLMRHKRAKATYRDLIYGMDILTKNILLLSGKNTKKEPVMLQWVNSDTDKKGRN